MRLFIAINLDQNFKNALTDIQSQMQSQHVRGNYTPAENLHITLAFIGEYPDSEEVMDALRGIDFKPFTINLDGFGCFGDLFWAGLSKSNELTTLVGKSRRALSDAGIPFDRKKFVPHITLVRKARYQKPPTAEIKQTSMKVNGFSLMRSDRVKNRMVYTEIESVYN